MKGGTFVIGSSILIAQEPLNFNALNIVSTNLKVGAVTNLTLLLEGV